MIIEDNNLKVMKLFFEQPEQKFHIRQIARLTGISSTGVINIIKRLKQARLLTSVKERMTELVEADASGRFPHVKRAYNLASLHDSGLVAELREFYGEAPILLVGKYCDGTDVSTGTVDLVVVSRQDGMPHLEAYSEKLKRDVRVMTLSPEDAAEESRDVLANGIVVSGRIE